MNPISPRQSLGQNFMTDPNTIRKIVAALEAPAGAPLVEIGPGMGALTEVLMERHPRLVALELDDRAVAYLREALPGLDVRRQDVLQADWAALARELRGSLSVIGNIPYYATSQILFALFEARRHVREAVLTMQLEVAQRLVAAPRTKAYGILSVMTQLVARPALRFRISPHCFYPKPDVTSAVVHLGFDGATPLGAADYDAVRQVVRAAFNQRRKTLRNSLKALARAGGTSVPKAWAGCRAEELTPEAFVELARLVYKTSNAQR